VATAAEAARATRELTPPVVVKPVAGSGYVGVTYIGHVEDAPLAFARARRVCPDQAVLIEEYLRGEELLIDGLVVDGALHIAGVAARLRPDPPVLYDTALVTPPTCEPHVVTAASRCAEEALRAIGFDYGAVRIEIIVCDGVPVVLELSGCCCGGQFHTDLAGPAHGVDMLSQALLGTVGRPAALQPTPDCGAALVYLSAHAGIVDDVEGLIEARSLDGITEVVVNVSPGDRIGHVVAEATGARIGYALATGPTAAAALANARRACDHCKVTTRATLDAMT
jgi:cysteine synthase A